MIARGKRSSVLATTLLLAALPGGVGLATTARAESRAPGAPVATWPADGPAPAPGPRLDRDAARLLDRDNLLILAAGGALAALTWNAIDTDRTAGRLHASSLDGLYDLGNEYGSGVTMGAGSALLLGIGEASGQESLTRLGGDLLRGFTLSSGLAWGLKASVQRRRPGGGPHSFPSGHTTIAFCAAPILAKHLGWRGGRARLRAGREHRPRAARGPAALRLGRDLRRGPRARGRPGGGGRDGAGALRGARRRGAGGHRAAPGLLAHHRQTARTLPKATEASSRSSVWRSGS